MQPVTTSAGARLMPALRHVLTIAFVLLACYAALIALLWWGQERLLFQPGKLPASHRFDLPADVHETWIDVPGARLNALHLRLPDPDGVVFFLHGNAGNLQSWFTDLHFYRRHNLDLFMPDYRGYGKSSGRIASQQQLLDDVRAAWQTIEARYAGKRRVFYGRSLGSGLAAWLAAEVQPELTVLVSPYASMSELAREHYPWVPGAVLRYPLATREAIARIQGPVLLAHGGRDAVIAAEHSSRLKALSPHAQLLLVPEADHGDIHLAPAYLEGLAAALQGPPRRAAVP
jgi:pimeloyl-ACP methyl ester carboxylesterase